MLNDLHIIKQLSRLFRSTHERRESDAAELFLDVNDANETEEALDAYFEFIDADPENAEAMRDLNAIWESVPELKHLPHPSAEELNQSNNWFSFPAVPMAAAAASLAIIGVVSSNFFFTPASDEDRQEIAFATNRGEMRPVALQDGSTVTLGGSSQITVALDDAERRITLLSGDSYMDVASDRTRPFVVYAGDITIRAIGTAFSVNKHEDGVKVAVSEGVVEVSTTDGTAVTSRLTAGEQLRFNEDGESSGVNTINMNNIASWRRGQLILDDEPLSYAVDAINRYYEGVISLNDPRLATMRASGVIDMYDPAGWLNGLQSVLPVEVRQTGEHSFLLAYQSETPINP